MDDEEDLVSDPRNLGIDPALVQQAANLVQRGGIRQSRLVSSSKNEAALNNPISNRRGSAIFA